MNPPNPFNTAPDPIERALTAGEAPVLTTAEVASMKAELMAHADWHQQHKTSKTHSLWARPWYAALGGTATAALAMLILTTGSVQSMPGEMLYPMKVHILEPVMLTLQHPELDALSVETLRLERRLSEVKALRTTDALTPEATEVVVSALVDHSAALVETLNDPDTPPINATTFATIDSASALIEAHQTLLTDTSATGTRTALDGIDTALHAAYQAEVSELAKSTEKEVVATYIDDSLSDIQQAIILDVDVASGTVDRIEAYIDAASDSLAAASLPEAHEAVSEARQLLLVEEYLDEPSPAAANQE